MDMSLAEDAQETMATLAPDRFFFMSPYRSFTTSGCFARYTEPAVAGDSPDSPFQQKLRQQFAEAKSQGIANPILVGAIPFDTRQPSSLFIPMAWQSFSRQQKQRTARYFTDHQPLTVTARKAIPEQDAFEAMVARAAMLTATPDVDKVVLSRLIDITTDVAVDSGALLERLVAQNPVSYNFHVPLADGGVLLGASPELLLRKEGERFSSLPLAGSARRQPDDVLDREAGNRLLASQKDRHEHELVTQAMKQILRDRSTELQLPSSPQLITTPTLWHLGTPFEGKANAGENALTLACLLHPTPALSGFPHQVAKKLIAELEPF
ncbi:TPA: isochorismate synthase EntC, partial [Salmonella enterica subsp. enterica serovar Typhi]|nr:isochorismate synthase EntC [Salmonella enterica subsp. enterica serovar Typhi]